MLPIFRLFAVLALALCTLPCHASDDYTLGPDSQGRADVPHGEVTHAVWTSKIFAGTQRDYWVYVPKQYDPAKPACVMIFQDGGGFQGTDGQFRVPVVFDNLIARKQMPVTIAIMINPGVVPAASSSSLPRFNRSVEYDSTSDTCARFLLEEILPEVGKKYNLSKDPNDRALCGASSGGICSFVAAWERPDQFRRVISFVGSFTNLRGGHIYGSLIRKHEPKPIRVFMQDGSNDQDIYSGSWFIGNTDVAAALKFGRYDVQFVVGDGGHNGKQGGAVLPDALRWLWRDYPAPIRVAESTPQPVMEVAQAGEDWQMVGRDITAGSSLATDAAGNAYLTDTRIHGVLKVVAQGQIDVFKENVAEASALHFGPDGRLYAALRGAKRIVAFDASGKESAITSGVDATDFVVNHQGDITYLDAKTGAIWHFGKNKRKEKVDFGVPGASGIALTPDQSLLVVTHSGPDSFAHSFQIQPDGTLQHKQPFFDLHVRYGEGLSGAKGMTTDTQGRLYVATNLGVQICDQAGRVIGILANPGGKPASSLAFGGSDQSVLFAVADGKLYRRKTKAKGVLSYQEPIKPPAPRL